MNFPINSAARFLLPVLSVSLPAIASEDAISNQQRALFSQSNHTVVVAVDDAQLFESTDSSEELRTKWPLHWAQTLALDSKRLASAPIGWLPIQGTNGKKAAKGRGAIPDVWVRRRDVVIESDYKKVRACWPIQSISYIAGDYSAEIYFKPDGSALVKEFGDGASISQRPPKPAQVYMAHDIVAIQGAKVSFSFGYRVEQDLLSSDGFSKKMLFAENALKDCATRPVLAK